MAAAFGHVKLLSVGSRETTGSGVYIYFDYRTSVLPCQNLPHHIGSSASLNIEGLKGGAGCVLFFKHGLIEMLELRDSHIPISH